MTHPLYPTSRMIGRLGPGAIALLVLLATACGGTPPTTVPPTPTLLQPPTAIPTVRPAAPTATAVGLPSAAPQPTAVTPSALVTSTLGASVTVTSTGVAGNPTAARTVAAGAARTTVPSGPTAASKPGTLSGKIAYSVVTDAGPRFHTIWTAKADGTGASKILDYAGWPALSPDGKSIAFFQFPGGGKNEGLYVADSFGGNATPAYINPGVCCINWSRDGNWIAFATSIKPNQPGGEILMVKADGTYKTVVDLKVAGNGVAFSPDNKQIVYSGCPIGKTSCGLMVATADGNGTTHVVTTDNGGNAQWSPRGDRLVYQASDGSGHLQVFTINSNGSGKKQLTNGKGNDGQPIWSRDGGSILWRSDQNGTAWALMVMNADGTNQRRLINDIPPDSNLWGWEALSISP